MKELLRVCTSESPSKNEIETFIQTDGVSLGSPLGPTFADIYMFETENQLLSQPNLCNPLYYRRYVDDIMAFFNSKEDLEIFKSKMQITSALEFTHEEAKGNSIHLSSIKMESFKPQPLLNQQIKVYIQTLTPSPT